MALAPPGRGFVNHNKKHLVVNHILLSMQAEGCFFIANIKLKCYYNYTLKQFHKGGI
jgi:hypothetical protein